MLGTNDQQATLSKLLPVDLPVNTLPANHELYKVRSSFFYIYVMNWIYNYRGYLRLSSEYFDLELFEMEILELLNPPPLDESVLFINKFKLAVTHQLTNSNKFETSDFDFVIKRLFLNTALGDIDSKTNFNSLSLADKFEIFYIILDYFSGLANFRYFLDKLEVKTSSDITTNILKTEVTQNSREEWILLFNDTKLYKRSIEYPELVIPKKRKLAPIDPEFEYEGHFDISLSQMEFKIEVWSLAEFEEFIKDVRKNSSFKSLKTEQFQNNLVHSEIKKRKIIQNRRKEYQLINLMATRKKSSRLEAKERQKHEDYQQRELRKEKDIKLALELDRLTKPLNYDTGKLTREDRLKFRKLTTDYRLGSKDSVNRGTSESARVSVEPENEPENEPEDVYEVESEKEEQEQEQDDSIETLKAVEILD